MNPPTLSDFGSYDTSPTVFLSPYYLQNSIDLGLDFLLVSLTHMTDHLKQEIYVKSDSIRFERVGLVA